MISVKEENVSKARSKETKKRQELYIFRENLSLNNICTTKLNLCKLVIIGQQANLLSLNDLSKLVYLQELWLVECNLKDISSLRECTKLEKLYVYSNEIERIPNLSKITRLRILSLSGNRIDRLTNIGKLENLEKLNVADNKLKRLPNIFTKNSNLKYVNLAGNHLYHIKIIEITIFQDMKNLRPLKKLESVVLNDPLYGDCPLARLCNHRSYVFYWLPQINRLDYYPINDAEKHWIDTFFKKNMMRCKIVLHNNMNVYFKSLKDMHEKFQDIEKHSKDLLRDIEICQLQSTLETNKELIASEKGGTLFLMEYHEKILKEREEMASIYFQITCRQLKLHIRHCDNVRLREYQNKGEDLMKICQITLEESLCPLTKKETGITGIRLYRVTEVFNKEINEYHNWNDQIKAFHEKEKSLKLLASMPGVRSIREWPMNVLKSEFYNRERIRITNCSAIADAKFYDKLRKKIFLDPCEKRRVSIFLHVPFHRCTLMERYTDEIHSSKRKQIEDVHRSCQMYLLTESYLFDTVFVAEYEYVFENDSNDNDKEEIQKKHHSATLSFEHLTRQKILLFLRMDEDKFLSLQKLSLTGQNIKTFQEGSLKLPNLRELDLSYNRLEQFPNDQMMIVNVNKINISFNEIRTIIIKEKLLALEVLDISWNCLTKCNESLETLKTFTPNLKTLNIERNPFSDIFERDKIILLTRAYFPKLENHFDSLDSKDCKNLSLKMARNTLSEFYDRHPTIFISHRPIRRVHLKKPSVHLVRLHLNDNCISDLDGLTQEHLPRLKYLDLTNNLITSLKSLGSYNTIVEFYCAHNKIRELKDIENLQNWHKLQVIDLCYNPIESAVVYKDFLIFHLIELKYISGHCVEKSNIIETRNTFGNILNKNMLLNMNVGIKLANLRQLDVVKCSIKKINLPSNLLPHLESVDLSRNQLISLESLNKLPKLKTLRLSYNRLETFQLDRSNNFDGFPNLSTLYLDHNRIGSITWDDDCNLFPTLKHLFLHYNKLSNVYGLRENSTLEILILDHNKIESIKEDSFNENNIITCLSIEYNQIQNLSFVKRLSRLKQLYIADNLIANEDELEKLTLLENLEELTLSGNPFYKTINYYKFCLRCLAKIQNIDGFDLSNKTCPCKDLSMYESVQIHSTSEN